MANDFVETDGLILVSGLSFEKIREKLDEKTIEYLVLHEPHRWTRGY